MRKNDKLLYIFEFGLKHITQIKKKLILDPKSHNTKCSMLNLLNNYLKVRSQSILVLDCKLNWKKHLSYLKCKLSRSCCILSKLRYYLNTVKLEMFYYSLFYLYIKYCISTWGGAANCYLKPIVCMQKRVIRYVFHVPALTTTNPLFLNWCNKIKWCV